VSLGIAAACGVDWLPADLALPFTTLEPGVDDNGDPLCVGTYVDDGFDLTTVGTSTDVVVSIDRRGCDAIFG
jgi:hypothetical protein